MKKTLLLTAAALLMSGAVMAQDANKKQGKILLQNQAQVGIRIPINL